MKIAGFLKPSTLVKAIIGIAVVVSVGAYLVMKVSDTNWAVWLKGAMDQAISETVYAEGDKQDSITANFDIPTITTYKNNEYIINWTAASTEIKVEKKDGFVTVVVTRPTIDNSDVVIRGTAFKDSLQVNKDYTFKIIKKTA